MVRLFVLGLGLGAGAHGHDVAHNLSQLVEFRVVDVVLCAVVLF